jgi:hypothetical protein
MAARSTHITFNNRTDQQLIRTGAKLQHGIWTEQLFPPESIEAGSSGDWQSESDGLFTGTEGTAQYVLRDVGNVEVHWDNPYVGSNSYTNSAPKGYEIQRDGGSGDNAAVTFTIAVASNDSPRRGR